MDFEPGGADDLVAAMRDDVTDRELIGDSLDRPGSDVGLVLRANTIATGAELVG